MRIYKGNKDYLVLTKKHYIFGLLFFVFIITFGSFLKPNNLLVYTVNCPDNTTQVLRSDDLIICDVFLPREDMTAKEKINYYNEIKKWENIIILE